MERIKLFRGVAMEIQTLEDEINDWLSSSEARVISVSGNVAPQPTTGASTFSASDVLVIITYEGPR